MRGSAVGNMGNEECKKCFWGCRKGRKRKEEKEEEEEEGIGLT